jgi:hypothetical protein
MGVDYPGAIDMLLPLNYSFDTITPLAIVQHSTGGDLTLDEIHNTFLATMRSTHFGIDRNGNVAQFVPLNRGAGGNCCPPDPTSSYASFDTFWNKFIPQYWPNMPGGLNRCTISIEHCNDSFQSLTMTPAQMDASNKLTLWLCQKFNIPTSNIKGHDSIDATNCPGKVFYSTYWQQMLDYVNKGLSGVDKLEAFNQEWSSGGLYRTGTGIAKLAFQDYLTPSFHGCPVSQEYPLGDKVVQRVNMGIWIWDMKTSTGKYYPYH